MFRKFAFGTGAAALLAAYPAAAHHPSGSSLPEPMHHGGPKGQHDHEEAPPPRGPALDLVLELNGDWHERQRIGGVTDANTGGNVVHLSPGFRLSMDRWSGFFSFGVPIVNNMNGFQAEPDWRILSGVSVNF